MRRPVDREKCYGPARGWLTILFANRYPIRDHQQHVTQSRIAFANHCLPLAMVQNTTCMRILYANLVCESCMRRSGVTLCSMDVIRHSAWQGEAALLPFGVTPPLHLPSGSICDNFGYVGSRL